MKKCSYLCKLLLLCIVVCFSKQVNAQVTIGSSEIPNANALLDLKETNTGTSTKGMLLPRVALEQTISANPMSAHVAGMTVYNTATVADVTPGYYYNDGNKWIKLTAEATAYTPRFFYMPSIVVPTDIADPSYNSATEEFSINLFNKYSEQFGLTNSTTSTKNLSATTLPVFSNSDLEYFITYYDDSVFQNVGVSDTGILTYKLNTTYTLSEKSFMNIVLKIKE